MANWSELHQDLLSLIITLIKHPSDHIRISGVCSSWRSAALAHRNNLTHPIPGLMISHSLDHRRFINFLEDHNPSDRKINVRLSVRCCGSHQGWLVLTVDDDKSMCLLNPFMDVRYSLPKLREVVEKAVLSSPPSVDPECVVLALFQAQGAAFCRIGGDSWIELQVFFYHEVGFCDALFFEGRFYVVDDYGKVYSCDLDHNFIQEIQSQPYDVTKTRYMFYLVEIKGEFCRVLRKSSSSERFYYENTIDEDDDDDDYNGGKVSGLFSTREFRVWKMDSGKQKWVRVHDLGEYALFLGKNNSICLSEMEVCGIKGNKIYFTDDRQRNVKHFGFLWPGKDMGCYDLGDSSIEPLCCTQCEWKTDPPAVWVAPLPW